MLLIQIIDNSTSKGGNNINKKDSNNILVEDENLSNDVTIQLVKSAWKDILEEFKNRRAMIIYASITTGRPIDCKNGVITIQYNEQYSFNKDRLEKPENNKVVNEVFSEVLKNKVRVHFTVIDENKENSDPEKVLTDIIGTEFLDIIDE